jgi:putative N6-adenine-specific DNA methylase
MSEPKVENVKMQFFAKCYQGLEDALHDELLSLGATDLVVVPRGIQFSGDLKLLYTVNYCSRLALRFLKKIVDFRAKNEQEIYDATYDLVRWHELFTDENTFAIDVVMHSSHFKHSKFLAYKTKDAIVDQFKLSGRKRPSVETENPDYQIHLHIYEDVCSLYLDASGESLHMRGYRKHLGLAPLSEVLAAGMLAVSDWTPEKPLIDPMCGSGTILLEAAMLSMKVPAQYFRKSFGFMNWLDFEPILWEEVRSHYSDMKLEAPVASIRGYDRDIITMRKCRENLIAARLYGDIQIEQKNFHDLVAPEEPTVLMFNPPYNERITLRDANLFYEKIGSTLKHKWQGHEAWIIAADTPATKSIGLKPSRKIPLMNGPIVCKFLKYEMYAGSKKIQDIE